MGGLEHVLGVEGGPDVTCQSAFERTRQCGAVCRAIDQDRLSDQRLILRAGAVFVRRADTFWIGCSDAARQEGGDIQLLPGFEIGTNDQRDLGIELHIAPSNNVIPDWRVSTLPGMTIVEGTVRLNPWRRRPRRGSRIPCRHICSTRASPR